MAIIRGFWQGHCIEEPPPSAIELDLWVQDPAQMETRMNIITPLADASSDLMSRSGIASFDSVVAELQVLLDSVNPWVKGPPVPEWIDFYTKEFWTDSKHDVALDISGGYSEEKDDEFVDESDESMGDEIVE